MRFVIRRLLLFAAALFGISIVVFAALRVLPGDVASVMAGLNSPPERVAALRSQLGLDRPLIAQYADWIGALLHGDFGTSILTGRWDARRHWPAAAPLAACFAWSPSSAAPCPRCGAVCC